MTATTVFFFAIVVALAAATDPQQLTHEFVLGGNPAEVLEILRPLCQDQYVGEDGSIRVRACLFYLFGRAGATPLNIFALWSLSALVFLCVKR